MSIDWYPNSRDEQLHMVKTWNTVFAASGQAWGIPQNHITQLEPQARIGDALSVHYSGGSSLANDITAWLRKNEITTRN